MKRFMIVILILVLSVLGLTNVAQANRDAADPPNADDPVVAGPVFLSIDLTVDPKGQPLGAYQIEMTSPDTSFTVVGVESGEHTAFDHGRPPYFDPVVQKDQTDRLILAEYAKPALKADELPTEVVRVATVHVMVEFTDEPNPEPLIQLTLTAAGNAEGERIDADVSYSFRTPERP
jgi:hypothetical protein